jgi:RHS repeat-associated protein
VLWNLLDPFSAANANTNSTTRGYTGHEQLDGVGLIHMNARLYDPEIGRFIQADSLVEPEATQGLNRYSYVLNNPLTFTDPTGQLSFRQVLGLVVGIAFSVWSGQLWAINNLWGSFAAAVGGGFASSVIATGSLKAGLWGAVSAAAFWGIGTAFSKVAYRPNPDGTTMTMRYSTGSSAAKVAAHAGAGGVLAHLQGGKFGSAFFAAGVTEWLSPAVGQIGMGDGKRSFGDLTAQTVVAATVGGTATAITGNGFGSGAQTAAFQHLFNQVVHDRIKSLEILQREGLMPEDRKGPFPSNHSYTHLDLICYVSAAGCTVDAVFNGVRRFPAPGADGSVRVQTGMITNVAIPGMLPGTTDHVLHQVNPSAYRVFNFTLGDHVLNPGWVARTVFQAANGVYVFTFGVGTGSNPFNVNGNQTVVNQVWGATNANIRACVAAGTC